LKHFGDNGFSNQVGDGVLKEVIFPLEAEFLKLYLSRANQ